MLVLKSCLLCPQLPNEFVKRCDLQTLLFNYLVSLLKGCLSSITKGNLELGLEVGAVHKGEYPNDRGMVSREWDDGREVVDGMIWFTLII